ncbi:GNAT family N-acetyltransferase [Paenibacillus agilis]|uniref:GNAT family N-acetyltransferase n=1 Tax=Paenibacillus agilis TaxID=3020863 RepID=A0A559J1K5_9BACL|nr:GNAT family N-acetyltransferase [Paenibacillus agilis]TVX93770.1 GNAT family N-acetyltransferase [Paenibacillus agilis]
MNLRLTNADDIEQLVKMRWDFSNEYSQNKFEEDTYEEFALECRSFLKNAIVSDKWFIWVAEQEGLILSHIYIERIDKVPRPGRKTNPFVYMTNVYTLPEHRGNRIGAQLLKKIEEWARTNHYEFIIVWPSEWSVEFYERNGYKRCQEPMELMLD